MRGAWRLDADNVAKSRITPAHAGSMLEKGLSTARVKDHPRACGEH